MISRPTTAVDVLRDSDSADRDSYGDEVETGDVAVYSDEPAMIVEKTVRGSVPGAEMLDSNLRVVTVLVAHMRPGLDVRIGDRLREADGSTYTVDTVSQQRFSPSRLLDVRLNLTRVT